MELGAGRGQPVSVKNTQAALVFIRDLKRAENA